MTNSKWGTKRTCLGCGKRFYDMQRNPIVCPSCDTPFEINRPENPRRPRAGAKPKPVSVVEAPVESPAESDGDDAKKVASETNGTEDIAEAEDKDAETLEDPSELGKDEDDVAEVLDGMEEKDKVET